MVFVKSQFWKNVTIFYAKNHFAQRQRKNFANTCAVQTKHGTNKFWKHCAKEYGLLVKPRDLNKPETA